MVSQCLALSFLFLLCVEWASLLVLAVVLTHLYLTLLIWLWGILYSAPIKTGSWERTVSLHLRGVVFSISLLHPQLYCGPTIYSCLPSRDNMIWGWLVVIFCCPYHLQRENVLCICDHQELYPVWPTHTHSPPLLYCFYSS